MFLVQKKFNFFSLNLHKIIILRSVIDRNFRDIFRQKKKKKKPQKFIKYNKFKRWQHKRWTKKIQKYFYVTFNSVS